MSSNFSKPSTCAFIPPVPGFPAIAAAIIIAKSSPPPDLFQSLPSDNSKVLDQKESTPLKIPTEIDGFTIPPDSDLARKLMELATVGSAQQPLDHGK